jgi:hypothetical protein
MSKPTRIDRIQKAMFIPEQEAQALLSPADMEVKLRYERVFTYWLQNPHLSDQKIVQYMINSCGLKKSTAYLELKNIKMILGQVHVASKEWHRHMVVEMCRKAYNMAMARKDPKAMALAADKIGKYTKLDKDEADALPWDELIPPNFEPDPDVSVLGIDRDTNIEEKRRKLRDKYLKKYDPAHFQEAEVIDEDD